MPPDSSQSRFAAFTRAEILAIQDGLMAEADLDPNEDETFPARVGIARRLINEIDKHWNQL